MNLTRDCEKVMFDYKNVKSGVSKKSEIYDKIIYNINIVNIGRKKMTIFFHDLPGNKNCAGQ